MEPKNNKATGSVKISEEVIATIVKSVLDEMDGVHSLATRPVTSTDVLMKNATLKPITIALSADVAVIDICVNLCFGVKLKTVAEQIQQRVKDTVQNMTGIAVSKVNVYVAGARQKEQA